MNNTPSQIQLEFERLKTENTAITNFNTKISYNKTS